jgi:outer membrane protein OmpA-like peptidoglycan-associated protein
MKLILALSVGMLLVSSSLSTSGELGFEDTAKGIAKRLLEPAARPAVRAVKTRSLGGTARTAGIKVRGLTLVETRPGRTTVVEKTVTIPQERTGGFVNLAVRFDVDSYAIRPGSIPLLDELGKALSYPGLSDRSVFVNGHTDSDGDEGYNLRLSLNRARAVKQYLTNNHAISPDRLKMMGYGEGVPLASNTSVAHKQLNRRVEIVAAADKEG